MRVATPSSEGPVHRRVAVVGVELIFSTERPRPAPGIDPSERPPAIAWYLWEPARNTYTPASVEAANPAQRLHETDLTNNVSYRRVRLGGTPGHRTVRPAQIGIVKEDVGSPS
jgi:hypothetical protein